MCNEFIQRVTAELEFKRNVFKPPNTLPQFQKFSIFQIGNPMPEPSPLLAHDKAVTPPGK